MMAVRNGWQPLRIVDNWYFVMLNRGRLVAKLPKERVDELVAKGSGERFDAGKGRPMKEWIALEAERRRWVSLAKEAYRFVAGASLLSHG
jgi:hypothetical protein